MIEFARHEFRLGKRDKDGKSLRETLQTVEKMTGRMPEEGINPVEFPDVLFDVWHWFCDLNASRQSGMSPSPISYLDIDAYCRVMGLRMAAWEVSAIKAIDRIALSEDPMEA